MPALSHCLIWHSMTSILVLRPGQAGADLVAMLAQKDVSARHAPTLTIEPLTFHSPEQPSDYVIFISPNAVLNAQQSLTQLCSAGKVLAVGPGTAAALEDSGISESLLPETFNSEGLLSMPELQQVQNKRVLIVKGAGGRKLLVSTLAGRGAICDTLDVYERHPCKITTEIWQWYGHASERGLTAASIETLETFEKQRLASNHPKPDFILVASDRIAETAQRLGYTNVHNVGGASNRHFARAIEQR